MKFVPPGRHHSPEDRARIRAQLRLTLACRRKMNTEEPNSFERGAHRRKAPVPVRVCFAGAGESAKSVPPASPCSSEDKLRVSAQLRLTFACRRKMDTEERNSVEKGAHRRKAPAPVRVCFAGASGRETFVLPGSLRSSEDRLRFRAHLRRESGNRRWGAPAGRDCEFVQNFFNISVTFPFTNYTYRGIIIYIQPKLKNFVK